MIKLISAILLISSVVQAKQVVIAVIDTGFNMKYSSKVKLCKQGHKSFIETNKQTYSYNGNPLVDSHGHGTHIAGLIAKNIKVDYCLVILKYTNPPTTSDALTASTKAFKHAVKLKVDVINYSGGGYGTNDDEQRIVLKALDAGIVIVAAAGNDNTDLEVTSYYPAQYDKRIVVVGNLARVKGELVRAPSSNYGSAIDVSVVGTDVQSLGGKMTGTSQSTAIITGKIANKIKGK